MRERCKVLNPMNLTCLQYNCLMDFCLCVVFLGLGIRILGSLTNCTNHIRDVHKAESERSKLFQKRKEENGGSVESDDTEHSNSAKKSRMRSPPHSAERAADVDGIMISRASILHRVQFLEETAESLRREADALRKLL